MKERKYDKTIFLTDWLIYILKQYFIFLQISHKSSFDVNVTLSDLLK